MVNKMKKRVTAPLSRDAAKLLQPEPVFDSYEQLQTKTRQLTKVLADKNEAHNWKEEED